jgi:signal peptidase II
LRVLFFTIAVILTDQLSKLYIKGITIPFLNFELEGMYFGESISVLGDFFKITFIENPGMAFGFNPGSDFKLWISLFSLAASIGLLVYLYLAREKSLSLRIAIAMILGGAIGNLIDRMFYGIIYDYAPMFYGKVVDFFDFDFFNFSILGRDYDRWPIFNIADASVTVGVLILIFFYRHHSKVEPAKDEESIEGEDVDVHRRLSTEKLNAEKLNEDDLAGNSETDKGKEISI